MRPKSCLFFTIFAFFHIFECNVQCLSLQDYSAGQNHHHHCKHEHPKAEETIQGVHIEPAHIVRKRSISQPFRISIFYDHSVYRLDPEKFDMINNTILPEAVLFWERALMVRKTGGPIKLNRKCPSRQVFLRDGRTHCIDTCLKETACGEIQVPMAHLNPCYVCNSSGLNCHPLTYKEMNDRGIFTLDEEEATTGGQIDDGTTTYRSTTVGEKATSGTTQPPFDWNEVPESPGVSDSDFVLYVSAIETERCKRGMTIAYAAHCQQEAALDRDAKGNPLTERRPDTGSPPLNEELQVHQWSDRVVRNITRPKWIVRGGYMPRTFNIIVTPRVVSENEAMTGTHTHSSVFSRITLALMEDTGWYKVDYSVADTLEWGKGLGCKFATASCKEWLSLNQLRRKNPTPLCTRIKADPLRTECSMRRDAVTLCNLAWHENPLPAMYQHFDSLPGVPSSSLTHYGGSVSLADYCPYLQEFSWRHKDQVLRGSRCSLKENTPRTDMNFALENYGKNSKCFEHSDHAWEQRNCKQIREWQHWGSGCYKYKCEQGRLHIIVGNYTYTCFHAGQILRIRIIRSGWLHRGGVMCPPCNEMCSAEFQSRGEYCKGGEEAPPPTQYHMDDLQCSTCLSVPSFKTILISCILLLIANFS